MATATAKRTAPADRVTGVKRIVTSALVPFSRQLASMLRAGMSLVVSLATIEEQVAHPGFRGVVTSVRETVEGGGPRRRKLSHGLRLTPAAAAAG